MNTIEAGGDMKTLTLRIDDSTYEILKKAAEGQRRTIPNFIEFAAMSYVASDLIASDEEMAETRKDPTLLRNIRTGIKDAREANYEIVS